MSLKAYRLLRNNQEQGPFTAEEIIQKDLKPYDLIWIDGRSAAWSYPSELAEFKNFAPLPNDENQSNKTISASVHAAIAMNNSIAQAPTQKPRYKVSAAWNKIQTITNSSAYKSPMISDTQKEAFKKNSTKQVVDANAKSLSWEDAWLDWEKEKTLPSPNIITPVKTVPAQKKSINETYTEPVLETKYSEPLDSLKDKYIDNILLQKQKSKKGSKFIIPSLALIVIFGVGYWLLQGNETTSALNNSAAKTEQTTPVANANQTTDNSNNIADNNANNDVANTTSQQKENVAAPIIYDQAKDRQPEIRYSKAEEKKAALITKQANDDAVNQSTQKQFDPSVINNVPADNSNNTVASNPNDLNANDSRTVRRRTYDISDNSNTSAQTNNITPVIKPAAKKTVSSYVSAPEYVQMNDGSANLKIQNISDVNLDLVVIDVQYFDASSRYHKGETMYLHNLKAGKNIIIKTPKDSNAVYATSKVSLVSSDSNNVNIIADN